MPETRPDQPEDGQSRPKKLKYEPIVSEEVQTHYSNNTQFKYSIWDFVMDFGMILDADEEKLRVKVLTKVIMSPQHAKVFAEVLTRNIKNYEETHGPIPVPPPDKQATSLDDLDVRADDE